MKTHAKCSHRSVPSTLCPHSAGVCALRVAPAVFVFGPMPGAPSCPAGKITFQLSFQTLDKLQPVLHRAGMIRSLSFTVEGLSEKKPETEPPKTGN